jgi:hypothetical protein
LTFDNKSEMTEYVESFMNLLNNKGDNQIVKITNISVLTADNLFKDIASDLKILISDINIAEKDLQEELKVNDGLFNTTQRRRLAIYIL